MTTNPRFPTRLLLKVLLATVCAPVCLAASASEEGTNPLGVKAETVCFTVHNPGDPTPIAVTGTRYHHNHHTSETRVILLLHGASETRTFFDGGFAGIDENSSFVRELARAGYVVITWDRPGYGESPYHGSGFALNFNSYVEMTHEIIGQIHDGTYLTTDGTCPSGTPIEFGSSSVLLGGHSNGAGEAMVYATRYHDIDALIPIAWNNQAPSSTGTDLFLSWAVPNIQMGHDYVTFYPPGASGVSDACIDALFWLPGVDPEVPPIECANEHLETTPSGEFASVTALRNAVTAGISNVGPTPVLLAFAEFDRLVTGAHNDTGDPDSSGQEVTMWEQQCNCDVSAYTQPDAGHALVLHLTMPDLAGAIGDWLESRGLEARP